MVKLEIKTLANDVFYVECEENESVCDQNFHFHFQMMNRREQGNQAFKQGRYQEAIDRYTEALDELQSTNSDKNDLTKCFSNRAQCHLNLQQYYNSVEVLNKLLR